MLCQYWKTTEIFQIPVRLMINSNTPDILRTIVESKRSRVEMSKSLHSYSDLEDIIQEAHVPLNFAGRLMGNSPRVIAEVKKASPSKGLFVRNLDVPKLANSYAENGAAAISVLTNEDHFQGSIADLAQVSETVRSAGVPVLRKEFIFDSYQIYEARAFGADAILLIVSMLEKSQLLEFMEIAKSIWLQCLVEVHDQLELEIALDIGSEVIGINNRNLRTFETTLNTTEELAPKVPLGKIVVSESGISNKDDIKRLQEAGAHAMLVGESLMRSGDPGKALKAII